MCKMRRFISKKPQKRRFKKRYLVLVLGLSYLFFNYSCLSFRSTASETRTFFESRNVTYSEATLPIGDREIHYVRTGKADAPTLVFIHGSPGSWDAWKTYLSDSTLLQSFRLIAPDRPGFGYSDYRKSMDLGAQAILLNTLLQQLDNGKPVTLIGHSYGGPLIVKMSLEAPQAYDNLMILSGSLDPEAEKPEKWRKLFMRFPLKYLVPGSFRPSNDELWMLKEDLHFMRPKLGLLTQNVLIVHGTKDRLVPYENVPFMKAAFTGTQNLQIIPLEDERHFIVWDSEDLIKSSLLNWLKTRN